MGEYQACAGIAACTYQFQTLIAGVLSIIAAIIGAGALWWTARSPLREARTIRDAEDDRRRRYTGSVLTEELITLRTRCRAVEGTVKVLAAGNYEVTDGRRASLMLPTPALSSEWEFMSRVHGNLLSELMKLWRHVGEHNQRMETVGTFNEDYWRSFTIENLQGIAKASNALSGQSIRLSKGLPPLPSEPIQLD